MLQKSFSMALDVWIARNSTLEMGGGYCQITEIKYARGKGYVKGVHVRTRRGGSILASFVRTHQMNDPLLQ